MPSPPKYSVADNPHKGNRGLTRAVLAARHSWSGLKFAYEEESAFRQELALAVVLIPLACWLDVTALERVTMIGVVLLLLIVELLNSSVEAAIDRISYDDHALSKRAKDFGSAAVMLALGVCVVAWAGILLPRFW